MGHAHVTNISRIFNSLLHAGPTSIRTCVDELVRRKQPVHASEGTYSGDENDYLIAAATQHVALCLFEAGAIEAYRPSPEQRKLLKALLDDDPSVYDWDSGDDGKGGEYGKFDTIRWKAKRKRLPIIDEWET